MTTKERKPKMNSRLIAAALVFTFGVANATLVDAFDGPTYYVDSRVQASGSGSQSSPFKTLPEALNATLADGCRIILAEGVYDAGVMECALGGHTTSARGVVLHKTYIKGAGRDKTFVVGAKATVPDADGNGADAVRCLLFGSAAEGSLVEGLTLTGGRTESADVTKTTASASVRIFAPTGDGSYARIADDGVNMVAKGGAAFAVCETPGGSPICFVDVTIDDCRAGYCGGAVYGNVALIRCLVRYCRGGLLQSGAVAGIRGAYCSIFTHNGGTADGAAGPRENVIANARAMNSTTYFVNCTMASNRGPGISKNDPLATANGSSGWQFFNCGFFDCNYRFTDNQSITEYNCAMNANGSLPNGKNNIGGDWGASYVGKQYWLASVRNSTGEQTWDSKNVKCDAYGYDQLVSIQYDFRPKANAFILDKGDVKWLSTDSKIDWVPEEYRGLDFKGDVRIDGTRVAIGAYQNGVTLGSPYIIKNFSSTTINGYTYEPPVYVSMDDGLYGEPYSYIMVESRNGEDVFGFTTANVLMNGHSTSYKNLYPLGYGRGTEFLIRPAGGSAVTYTYVRAASVKWVDPKDGKDEDGRGSEDAPCKTLQYAADNSTAKGVVYLKAGEYREGEGSAVGDSDWLVTTKARLTIKKSLRICGVEGAEKTFVCGRESTDSGFVNTGCGSGALRCIAFCTGDADGAVQGVTLTGGRTDSDPVGKLKAAGKKAYNIDCFNWAGGAFIGWSWTSSSQIHIQFFDCIISNCVAYRASAACNGAFHRCVFTRNRCVDFTKETNTVNDVNGMLQNCIADSCLFVDNPDEPYGILHSGSSGGSSRIVNCTVKGDNAPACTLYRLKAPQVYNTIVDNFATLSDVGTGGGNVVWPDAGSWMTDNRLVADPMIANTAEYKCRTVRTSPAECCGIYGNWIIENTAYRGLDGARMEFDANGSVNAGCYQKLVNGCRISANCGMSTDKDGTYAFEESEGPQGIEIKAKVIDRPFSGFSVNGTLVPGTAGVYSYVWSSEANPPAYAVEACYKVNADIYADPSAPDDSAGGFSPDAPKRTLNAALELAMSGDTVHLAEGVYSDNAKVHGKCVASTENVKHVIPAVGIVPAGVTLVADGEQAKTVIRGKWGTGTKSAQNMTFGENAVRCLVAYENTKIKGVTLHNGGVLYDKYADGTATKGDDNCGAGVLGTGTTVYEDCFFSNLVAYSSAGFASPGTAIRCKFIRCGSEWTSVCNGGKLYDCYVNRCFDRPIGSAKAVVNCTIGPDNRIAFEWDPCGTPVQIGENGTLENTLVLTPASSKAAADNNLRNVRNCMFHISHTNRFNGTTWGEGCEFVSAFNLDANGRPSKESCAVDAGYNDATAVKLMADMDLDRNQRIYNGTVDIGCYEYDWRGEYAKDLGHKAITAVTVASPEVRENADGKVELADGARLVFKWPGKGSPRMAEFDISGGGELTVTETGKDPVTYTAASPKKTYEVESSQPDTELAFSFSGDGVATIGRCYGCGGLTLIVR